MDKCIFCGSDEEVSMIPVDSPANLQPVCIDCYESAIDACRDAEVKGEK